MSEKQLLNQQSNWPLVNGAAESGDFGLDVCYINHFIGLLKTFPFIVIILRYRAHKSVPSSLRPSPSHATPFRRLLLCFIPIQSLVSELIMGSTGRLSHIFLNFSLLLTCWAPLLLMATTTGTSLPLFPVYPSTLSLSPGRTPAPAPRSCPLNSNLPDCCFWCVFKS